MRRLLTPSFLKSFDVFSHQTKCEVKAVCAKKKSYHFQFFNIISIFHFSGPKAEFSGFFYLKPSRTRIACFAEVYFSQTVGNANINLMPQGTRNPTT